MDLFNNIFEWGNISTGVYVAIIITGMVMYTVIFHLEKIIGERNTKIVHNYTEKCVVSCTSKKTCNKINKFRDKGYYLFDEKSEKCVVTKWEISHFITHLFLGYFTNIYISQSISVGFEMYEHYVLDCGSYLDLVYNLSGFIIGHLLKNYIC
jgi:hypothetical protein